MYFHVYLIYRFTRTFTDHSSVITRCWGFELQNGKSSLKSQQTLATQGFAPASFLSTPDKNHQKLRFLMVFCCKKAKNDAIQNVGQMLTHTVTHTRKCAERVKEYRRGGFAPSPIFLMFFFCSHHLCHEAAHRLCSFILLLPCGVGVGSQGKACIVVPQHTADRFHVHTVL